MSTRSQKLHASPYSKLALIYDDIMSHVDYRRWAQYISAIIERYNKETNTILDIACGTGSLLLELYREKYQLIGFDFSFDMVKKAREKRITSNDLFFYQGDMRFFSLNLKVDAALCLYDSINYLTEFDQWKLMFDCVWRVLSSGGLFIFDICTEKNSIKYFSQYIESNAGENYDYKRESSYDKRKNVHINKFAINFDHEYEQIIESHVQRIYLLNEVEKLIAESKFHCLGIFDGFSFRRGSENSLRVHYVLQKVV